MTQADNGTTPVSLVVFDLGRVLVRLCDGWRHACSVGGVPVPAGEIDADTAARLMASVCESETGKIDLDGFARAAAPLLGLTVEQVKRVSDVYLLEPFPGVIELLDELKSAGHRTACLSNTNVNHWGQLHDPANTFHAVTSRLGECFASHLIGARKPDPLTFEHVERATSTPPDQILFFDDLPENIESARARGWHGCRIDPARDPVAQIRESLRAYGVLPAQV